MLKLFRNKKRIRLVGFIASFLFVTLAFSVQTKAEINITVDREFIISSQGEMQVTENEQLVNNFSDRYIPGGTERRYYFVISAQATDERKAMAERIYNSLELTLNGQKIDYERVQEGNDYGIKYFLRQRLNPHGKQTVVVRYTHPELGERTGGLLDAYIPAFANDFKFKLDNSVYSYTTKLKIPSNSGTESIVSVTPLSKFVEGEFDVYVFDQESLRGRFVWVQRGQQQVYKFQLTQALLPTQRTGSGGINEYQIILPRDIRELNVQQQVYFQEITPNPIALSEDKEGNLIGIFQTAADQEQQVVISGYALLSYLPKLDLTQAGTISEFPTKLTNYSSYTQPAEYWEAAAPAINDFAEKSVVQEQDVYKVMNNLYQAVIDRIDYSEVKRFGLNERQGALHTLQGGAAVCMEYSDLYLTLLRNRGIATRAVFGYGFDSRLGTANQEAHQWVQVYLPSYQQWVSVDVTWGESGNKVIGGDLNHFYTHVASKDPNTPAVLSRVALGNNDSNLVGPTLTVSVMAEIPAEEKEGLLTEAELLAKYPQRQLDDPQYLFNYLLNKYSTTITNLFNNPQQIDAQGWFLLLLGLVILLTFAGMIFNTLKRVTTRKQMKQDINPHLSTEHL